MDRNAVFFALFALALAAGCKQEEGEVCQRYPNGETDCGEGLSCCGTPRVCPGQPTANLRGICIPEGAFCDEPVEPVCEDGGVPDGGPDAGSEETDGGADAGEESDAGAADAGEESDAGVDEDAGSDLDAGTDAGPVETDAGTDASAPEDAGADATA